MAVSVLKGDLRPVRTHLETEMMRAAGELKFEVAQRYKQRLDALDNYSCKSVIVSAKITDVDVFSLLVEDEDVAYCNFVRIRHGSASSMRSRSAAGSWPARWWCPCCPPRPCFSTA